MSVSRNLLGAFLAVVSDDGWLLDDGRTDGHPFGELKLFMSWKDTEPAILKIDPAKHPKVCTVVLHP